MMSRILAVILSLIWVGLRGADVAHATDCFVEDLGQLVGGSKWVNGTVLHFRFLDDSGGVQDQQDVVRGAFQEWKDLGIGLTFDEVDKASESEIRIGFVSGDGSWSYVGRDVLGIGTNDRTMK